MLTTRGFSKVQGVNKIPIENKRVLWKTIAPITLANAKSSFPCFSQITLFIHSGNSVANGVINKAKIAGEIFKKIEKYFISSTKMCEDKINKINEIES